MPSPDAIQPPRDNIALFLDVDGTLVDIAPTPDAVQVPPDLSAILSAASAHLGGALALLSGRSLAELDRLTAPLKLPASGLHGGEFRANSCRILTPPLPAGVTAGVRELVASFAGCSMEDKVATLAVHYRAAPHAAPALRAALLAQLAAGGHADLEIAEGDHILEIKPRNFDKGAALRRFMRQPPFAGRRPVFIADHPIDNAAFEAASGLGGVGFAVGQKLPGTAGFFTNPAAVRDWLRDLAA